MSAKYKKIDVHCFPRGYDQTLDKHLKKMDANNVEKAVIHGMVEYIIEQVDKFPSQTITNGCWRP